MGELWKGVGERTGCATSDYSDKTVNGEEICHCEGWRSVRAHDATEVLNRVNSISDPEFVSNACVALFR